MLKIGPLMLQYALVIVVNLNMMSTGLGIAWPSPVLVKLMNASSSPFDDTITEEQGSWVVSIGSLVGLIGNFITGYILNRLGRKYTLVLAAIPKILGFLLGAYASAVWMLYLGRSLLGLSDALTFTVVPMYASEVASKEVRGSLGTVLQISCSLGVVTVLCMGPFLGYFTLNIICTCISVATILPILFVPDSPYFLHTKGKYEEATRVLTLLRGSETLVNEEIKEYELSYNDDKIDLKKLIKSKAVIKALILAVIIGVGVQATGYNAITFYLQTILVSSKTSVSSEFASVVIGLIQLAASFFTIFLIDRFGRKPIICSCLVGVIIGLIGLGTFFKLSENGYPITGVLQYVPLVSLVFVVYFYSAGIGSLMWPLLSELFEGQVRALGMSVGIFSTLLFIFLSTRFFAPLTLAIGAPATYWLFSANCLIFCVFIAFCVPETKGRTFAEIQYALGERTMQKTEYII